MQKRYVYTYTYLKEKKKREKIGHKDCRLFMQTLQHNILIMDME